MPQVKTPRQTRAPRTRTTPRPAAKKVAAPADDRITADAPIEKVWVSYRRKPSDELRNRLLEYYLHLVKYHAERVHHKLPDEVDVNDLIQAGFMGLKDAIEAFDLGRGVKFETYCAPRIRGAILDELRSMDWVPRLVRSRTAKVENARKALRAKFGREPSETEIARHLKVDPEELKKLLKDGRTVGIVSLNRKWYETDSNKDVREIDVFEDNTQTNPLRETQKLDLKELITRGLSRAERLIVILYYYEELTMKEIGATLDLSESRVSQMHSSILARLRAQLSHRERDFYPA